MALPRTREARQFYRSAKQRFEDATFLLEGSRTNAAVYLAGYCVECMLKALLLETTPDADRADVLASFRGSRGHSFDWLRYEYRLRGGAAFPKMVARSFAFVNEWDTGLRYESKIVPVKDAADFLSAVEEILVWADGRL